MFRGHGFRDKKTYMDKKRNKMFLIIQPLAYNKQVFLPPFLQFPPQLPSSSSLVPCYLQLPPSLNPTLSFQLSTSLQVPPPASSLSPAPSCRDTGTAPSILPPASSLPASPHLAACAPYPALAPSHPNYRSNYRSLPSSFQVSSSFPSSPS